MSKYAKNLYFVWLKGNFQNSEPKLQNLARKLLELKKGAMNGMLQLARLNEPHSLGCFYLIVSSFIYHNATQKRSWPWNLCLKHYHSTHLNTNLASLKSWEALGLRNKHIMPSILGIQCDPMNKMLDNKDTTMISTCIQISS